ncbi:MAG TPA: nucleotide-binding protein [Pyrinomonadaceae bacterium]|jgi:hypothetical protein|nr:nucleotide-binding protein [Pyrinomonadaceae bacterium]
MTKIFIGSSEKNIGVARAVAKVLNRNGCGGAEVWDEVVAKLGKSFLETLVEIRGDYDFAVMIWASDDVTESKGTTVGSPRDNVVFECGLFMGALGRERVFVVHDKAAKIPSDFAGITLAPYDGARAAGGEVEGALLDACSDIAAQIKQSPFAYMVGEWKSRYVMTCENGHPVAEEVVEVRPARAGISITSRKALSTMHEQYAAHARPVFERQLIGEWRSEAEAGDIEGLLLLKIHPRNKIMYGYFSSPDECGATVFGSWVLARMDDGADDEKVAQRLKTGERMLLDETFDFPPAPPVDLSTR